jgi:hypothetical protein
MGKQANLELVTLTDGMELPDAGKTKVRGLAADGTLGLPTDTDIVGWFGGSSR